MPFKSTNNGVQTNESLVNESNFPSIRFLCIHFQSSLGKVCKQFLYKYQFQAILIFPIIWLGMIRLKYNSFDTDMGIQMM